MSSFDEEQKNGIIISITLVITSFILYSQICLLFDWFNFSNDDYRPTYLLSGLTLQFSLYVFVCLTLLSRSHLDLITTIVFVLLSLLIFCGLFFGYANLYKDIGLYDLINAQTQNGERKAIETPSTCLYFSIITLTTVGYGDIVPTPAARMYAASQAVTGAFFFALFFATLVHSSSITGKKPST